MSSLPLLSAAERHALLSEWSDTGSGDAGDAAGHLVHELTAAWAARFPAGPAVIDAAGEVLSYSELDAQAASVAPRKVMSRRPRRSQRSTRRVQVWRSTAEAATWKSTQGSERQNIRNGSKSEADASRQPAA